MRDSMLTPSARSAADTMAYPRGEPCGLVADDLLGHVLNLAACDGLATPAPDGLRFELGPHSSQRR